MVVIRITRKKQITVATLLQAHPPGWAFECLGPNVQLELEPTRGGLIIQSERYPTPLDFIRAKLTNEEHREPISKTIKYKKLLAENYSEFPATNEEKTKVSESLKANKRTLTVTKIFEILQASSFFKTEYLPVLDTMSKVDKETGARIPAFKT